MLQHTHRPYELDAHRRSVNDLVYSCNRHGFHGSAVSAAADWMPELAVGSAIADISNLTQEFLREKAAVPSAVLRDGYNPRRIVTKKLQSKFTRFFVIRQVFVSKKRKN